jgi:hypothetical protein
MNIKYFIALLAIIIIAGCKQQDDLAAKKNQLAALKKQEEDVRFQMQRRSRITLTFRVMLNQTKMLQSVLKPAEK